MLEKKFYVVKLGGKLYTATKFYGIYPKSTPNLLEAVKYDTFDEAYKASKKAIHAKVEGYKIVSLTEEEMEKDNN